jgi:hypothetical protein
MDESRKNHRHENRLENALPFLDEAHARWLMFRVSLRNFANLPASPRRPAYEPHRKWILEFRRQHKGVILPDGS